MFDGQAYQTIYEDKINIKEIFKGYKPLSCQVKKHKKYYYLVYAISSSAQCRVDPISELLILTIYGDEYIIPYKENVFEKEYLKYLKISESKNAELEKRFQNNMLSFECDGTYITSPDKASDVEFKINRDARNIFKDMGPPFKLRARNPGDPDGVQYPIILSKDLKKVKASDPEGYYLSLYQCNSNYIGDKKLQADLLINTTDKVMRFILHPLYAERVTKKNYKGIKNVEIYVNTPVISGRILVQVTKEYTMTNEEVDSINHMLSTEME